MRFYITEGGNLALRGVNANTIDLTKVSRKHLVNQLIKLFAALNRAYYSKYKDPLWRNIDLEDNKIMSGSSKQLFNTVNITDNAFSSVKRFVGDIDVMVDNNKKAKLLELFTQIVDKKIGPAVFLGNRLGNEQTSTLWKFSDPALNLQIDFEFVQFNETGPTEWSTFSHSSAWEDMQKGIKGVFHKLLVRSLATTTERPFFLRKKLGRSKLSQTVDIPSKDSMFTFAVSSKDGGGLRPKYQEVIDPATAQPITKDGLPVYKKLYKSPYEKDLSKILESLLGSRLGETSASNFVEDFWSFAGLVRIMNKFLNDEDKQKVANKFLERTIGPDAQGLYRNDPERDMTEKLVTLRYFYDQLGLSPPTDINQKIEQYKQNYRMIQAVNPTIDINTQKILETTIMDRKTLQKFVHQLRPLLKEASPDKKIKALKMLETAVKDIKKKERREKKDTDGETDKPISSKRADLDAEFLRTWDYAQRHYPLASTPELAFLKFVQRSLMHAEEDSKRHSERISEIEDRLAKMEKMLSKIQTRKTEVTESKDYTVEK